MTRANLERVARWWCHKAGCHSDAAVAAMTKHLGRQISGDEFNMSSRYDTGPLATAFRGAGIEPSFDGECRMWIDRGEVRVSSPGEPAAVLFTYQADG